MGGVDGVDYALSNNLIAALILEMVEYGNKGRQYGPVLFIQWAMLATDLALNVADPLLFLDETPCIDNPVWLLGTWEFSNPRTYARLTCSTGH